MSNEIKLETLTDEQIRMLPVYRDNWIKIGLSCEPLNLKEAVEAVNMAYNAAGLANPEHFFIADSPRHCAYMSYVLKTDGLSGMTQEKLSNRADALLKDGSVPSNLIRDQISDQIYGSHDAGWLSFYDAVGLLGLSETVAPLKGLMKLATSCGWWAPYENAAILQHRHSELHLDERGMLHSETGPAVKYRDGFGVWAIHGVRVPRYVVESPNEITIEKIDLEPNIEIRRVMIERMGTSKYLRESGATLLDMDQRSTIGGGPRALFRGKDGQTWLVGTDGSTSRTYFMNVPQEATTCSQAHTLIAGVDENLIIMEG